MNRIFKVCAILLMVSFFNLGDAGHVKAVEIDLPKPTVSFHSIQVINMAVMSMRSSMYYDKGKMRTETSGTPMMGNMTVINREDKGVSWTLDNQAKTYKESPLKEEQTRAFAGMQVLEYEEVGVETIQGFDTRKYKAIFLDQQGNKGGGFFWFTEHNIAIKMDMVVKNEGQNHKISVRMEKLDIGPQAASLFEIPQGFSKGGGGLFGGMFGGGNSAMPPMQNIPPQAKQQYPPQVPQNMPPQASQPGVIYKNLPAQANGTVDLNFSHPSGSTGPLTVTVKVKDRTGAIQPRDTFFFSGPNINQSINVAKYGGEGVELHVEEQISHKPLAVYHAQTSSIPSAMDNSVVGAAKKGAEDGATDTIYNKSRDAVTKGLGKLFSW